MALKEQPAEWRLIAPIPEARDTQSRLTQVWTPEVKEPISLGNREFPLTKPLQVTVTTQRIPEGVEVSIQIETEVATECRRCCEPLTVAICDNFMYAYILQSEDVAKVQDEEDFSDSDKIIIPVTHLGSSINVSAQVWECLVLSLPVYASCPEGCADQDSLLPTEDQVDPRLLALADLLEQEKHKGGK